MTEEPNNHRTRVHKVSTKVLRQNRIVAPFLDTEESAIYRMLRTQVRRRLRARGAKTLGICSAVPGEGKSFVSLNLAISLSMDTNQTILLVELDFRRPAFASYLGLNTELGLTDILRGEATVEQCLFDPGFPRLVILPAGRTLARSSEAVASPRMNGLAREFREKYPDRLVIYDLPPVLSADDALAFFHNLDAALLVVQEGGATAPDVQRMLNMIERDKVIGSVLNKAARGGGKEYHRYNGAYS